MRNITKGLEQRLAETKADRAQLERRIVRLGERLALLKQVLGIEKTRLSEVP